MRTILVAAFCTAVIPSLTAQDTPAPGVTPAFEVVVLKRNTSGSTSMSAGSRPGGVTTVVNGPISTIFGNAYPTESNEVVGAPDWFSTERYDLTARLAGDFTTEQRRQVWRDFFAERMKLKAHYETREQPSYALVLARSDGRLGPNLKLSAVDCAAPRAATVPGADLPPAPPASNGMPACSTRFSGGTITSGGQTMARLARSLAGAAGRFVVDRTGLTGTYEFALEYSTGRAGEPADDKPDIFTALQEQLGLKLEPARSPVEIVVIDHIERPIVD